MNRNQYIATILLAFTALISSAEMSPREIKAEFQLMVPPQFQRALPPNLIKIEIEKTKSCKVFPNHDFPHSARRCRE